MMRLRIIVFAFAALLGSIPAAPAQDTGDTAALSDRLDRMQRDLDTLQRQVYRGGTPAPAGGAATEASGPLALQTEDRMAHLEDEMRDLNGKFEVINNQISQMNARLDKLSNDVDMRLSALEHGAAPAGANAPPPATSGEAQANAAASAGAAAATPNAQYDAAFALLRRADYPDAEQALRAFVVQHPKDPLAGNAQYWLGETYYVRKNWKDAAIAFAEGYQKYPKSSKAPDDLLKLAMSLGNMGQKANACTALARLDHDFPQMPANVRGPATTEKRHLGC
ncbi:MAG: tol-pal system protein YbgF [Alphaproteobacteria bacterium]|nr:tol-pal system protein YbgF [Alphaproteobacteria bacterium]